MTDPRPERELGRQVAGGAATMLVARGAGTIVSIGAMAIIARHVTPDEFGLVGMVVAILAIARVLEELGLGDAAIQRESIEPGEVTTLAIVNTTAGLLLGIAFAATAPLIASFYDQPELVPFCLALSPMFVLAGVGAQPRAMMRRAFRFRPLALAQVASLVAAGGGGVLAALAGWGPWAVVVQHLASGVVLAAGCWIGAKWRPARPAPLAAVRPMLGYGANLGASQLLNALTRNIDDILLGRFVGPAAVGAYGRAFQLMTLPSTQLNQPLTSAVVPALSRLQSDPEAYRRLYRSSVEIIASLAFPLAVFTGVAAPAMVLAVLGPAWNESIPLLRALSPAGLMVSLNVATGWVYLSLGRTDRQLRWRIVGSSAAIIGVVSGLPWGALGVALGLSTARVVMRLPAVMYCFHGTSLSIRDIESASWRAIVASAIAGAATWWLDPAELVPVGRLAVQAALFIVAWLVSMSVLPGGLGRLAAAVTLVRSLRGGGTPDVA
jgi:O-antigen/teichoic acid export membrane protein